MPKNKRKSDSENAAEGKKDLSKAKRGKGLRTGAATLTICAASFGAYYSPHFRAASSDWLERGRALLDKMAWNDVAAEKNGATADEAMREKLAQAPSFRDFLTDEYGEEGARELLGIDATTDVPAVASGGFANYVVAETNASETALESREVATDLDEPPLSAVPEAGPSFADYVAAETAAESVESQEVASGVDALLNSPIPESGASFADYVAAEEAALESVEPQEVANDVGAPSPTWEAEASAADYAASKPVDDSETDVWEASVEKTRLASAVESVGAEVSGEDEAALATRLQDEMKKRGVGAPRIERWGGRFWRASGFATTDDGVATFCEAVDVDPTSAQRTALEKFDAARF